MRRVYYRSIPYVIEDITLALESGVDGLIVPDEKLAAAKSLARTTVFGESAVSFVTLASKADEEHAAALVHEHKGDASRLVALTRGWEIIPLENLLATAPGIAVEVGTLAEALLAKGVLERGVDTLVVTPDGLREIKAIVADIRQEAGEIPLRPARITRIVPAGMGHRVCVDTTRRMKKGQGMLVGNSAAFTFLVNAETEHNEYVASRPFRVNAGGVHSYALMPGDRTCYLDELGAGAEVLIVNKSGQNGRTSLATVGRVKVEIRPMLLVEAVPLDDAGTPCGPAGAVFLQNAETIRLVTPEGEAVSVVTLQEGDRVLCRVDSAGRHFGVRITEDIKEG